MTKEATQNAMGSNQRLLMKKEATSTCKGTKNKGGLTNQKS
jgi:hypothetical protein